MKCFRQVKGAGVGVRRAVAHGAEGVRSVLCIVSQKRREGVTGNMARRFVPFVNDVGSKTKMQSQTVVGIPPFPVMTTELHISNVLNGPRVADELTYLGYMSLPSNGRDNRLMN